MQCKSQIAAIAVLVLGALSQLPGQTTRGSLNGNIEENYYLSPTSAYRVRIPVIAALGGSITDTENVVTFQDNLNTHQSLACFKLDATQFQKESSLGRKDYLIWFFANFVQADFEQRFPGARIESAHFLPELQGGALLVYNLLPGGSWFTHRALIVNRNAPPVAKRGNILFLHGGHIYILSIELAEKVIEGTAYTKSTAEEDALLRSRLTAFLDSITFNPAPGGTSANTTTTATANSQR